VTALTTAQMADIHGLKFWKGFLCGAGIVSSIAISASPDAFLRWGLYLGTMAACGEAFS